MIGTAQVHYIEKYKNFSLKGECKIIMIYADYIDSRYGSACILYDGGLYIVPLNNLSDVVLHDNNGLGMINITEQNTYK